MQRQHDLGGQPAGPIDTEVAPTKPWAKLITATIGALRERELLRTDEVRRALEDLPKDEYDMTYFDRWSAALCNLMAEKGLLTEDEVRGRMAELRGKLKDKA